MSRFFVLFLCFSCSVLFAQVRFPHGSGVVDITKAPYNAKNDGKTDITDKTVLLIDDVKTSGATLNECGKMLYLNGANSVICLTAAVRNSKI